MRQIAMKTVSYLPEWEFRYRRSGQYVYGTNKDILSGDDFKMTMTLFNFDGQYTCWIGMDMARCDKGFYEVMWEGIQKVTDLIDRDHFLVSGTHTHTGPTFNKREDMAGDSDKKESMDKLAYHCAALAGLLFLEIKDSLREFDSEIKTVKITGAYSNRNDLNGPCDNNAVMIRFLDHETKENLGMWFAMNCHSTMMFPKNTCLCTDLVGFVSHAVAEHYGICVMPMCGAQGDTSTRLTRRRTDEPDNNINELRRISGMVIDQVLESEDGFEAIELNRFTVKHFSVSFVYDLDPKILNASIKKAEEDIRIAEASGDREQIRAKKTGLDGIYRRLNSPLHSTGTIPCSAYNLGELKFAAFSGELFAELGLKVIRHEPHDHRMVVCYINDRGCGYLVNRSEYGKSFESMSSIIPIGIPEVLTDMAISELDQFDVANAE